MNSRRFIPNMIQAVSVDRVKFQAHKTRHSFSEPCLMWPCAAGIMPSDRWYGRNIKCSVPTGKKVYINTCRDGIIFRFAYLHKQHLTSAAWRSSQWAVLRLRHSEQRLPCDTVFYPDTSPFVQGSRSAFVISFICFGDLIILQIVDNRNINFLQNLQKNIIILH